MLHSSNSSEQLEAERELVLQLSVDLGVALKPMSIELEEGVRVTIDGFNEEHRVSVIGNRLE